MSAIPLRNNHRMQKLLDQFITLEQLYQDAQRTDDATLQARAEGALEALQRIFESAMELFFDEDAPPKIIDFPSNVTVFPRERRLTTENAR
jgi:hypothetical protein